MPKITDEERKRLLRCYYPLTFMPGEAGMIVTALKLLEATRAATHDKAGAEHAGLLAQRVNDHMMTALHQHGVDLDQLGGLRRNTVTIDGAERMTGPVFPPDGAMPPYYAEGGLPGPDERQPITVGNVARAAVMYDARMKAGDSVKQAVIATAHAFGWSVDQTHEAISNALVSAGVARQAAADILARDKPLTAEMAYHLHSHAAQIAGGPDIIGVLSERHGMTRGRVWTLVHTGRRLAQEANAAKPEPEAVQSTANTRDQTARDAYAAWMAYPSDVTPRGRTVRVARQFNLAPGEAGPLVDRGAEIAKAEKSAARRAKRNAGR